MDKTLFCEYFLETFGVITSILCCIGWYDLAQQEDNREACAIVALFVIMVSFISALLLYD